MAVIEQVVQELRDCGWGVSMDGPELVVSVEDDTVRLLTDDRTLTPDPQKPDWISFLRWYARGMAADRVVDVMEKPWKFSPDYARFLVETKLEAM